MDWIRKKEITTLIKRNEGMTTIIVVCVMAIIMMLSLGLFLTASVLMRTAARTSAAEQSRILAISLSEMLEQQLTAEDVIYQSQFEEAAARAQDLSGISLWHYVRQNIEDGSWPYYEENGIPLHSRENAVRSFQMEPSGIASEIADNRISIYWTGKDEKPDRLVVETKVTVKGETCVITDVYQLQTSGGGDYESWRWSHVEKR